MFHLYDLCSPPCGDFFLVASFCTCYFPLLAINDAVVFETVFSQTRHQVVVIVFALTYVPLEVSVHMALTTCLYTYVCVPVSCVLSLSLRGFRLQSGAEKLSRGGMIP